MAYIDKEKQREWQRKWNEANPEKVKDKYRKYRVANKEKLKAAAHKYYAANKDKLKCKARKRRESNPGRHNERTRNWRRNNVDKLWNDRQNVTLECCSIYSAKGDVMCSYPTCDVADPDMLCLDHINNNGNEERRDLMWGRGGYNLYAKLRRSGFPPGYQTLCHNHNIKKEIERRRADAKIRHNRKISGSIVPSAK